MKYSHSSIPVLTIGIPTFNRRDAVLERLQELLSFDLDRKIEILIIDNHSSDGTISALQRVEVPSHLVSNIQILENDENLGYDGNFYRLFSQCRTDYLLISSDEDEIFKNGINDLLNFLVSQQPDFVSPQALINGLLYRGKNKSKAIEFYEHPEASFYISGLCFKTESAMKFLDFLKRLSHKNALVEVYPQTALAGCLVAMGSGYWLDVVVATKRADLPSSILHSSGNIYFHLPGRYEQFKGSLELNDLLLSHELIPSSVHSKIRVYNSILHRDLFKRVRGALREEDADLAREFDRGAIKFYLISFLLTPLRYRIGKVVKKIKSLRSK